jgi:lantibiotic modifying enzyme
MGKNNDLRKIAMRLADESYVNIESRKNEEKYTNTGLITHTLSPLTLSHGYPSLCILFSELGIMDNENSWLEYSNMYVNKIANLISERGIPGASLFSGTAGIALAIKIASIEGKYYTKLQESLNDYLYDQIDGILDNLNHKKSPEMFDYDVMEGLAGISNYLLSIDNDIKNEIYLKKILDYFVYLSGHTEYKNSEVPKWHILNENLFTEDEKDNYENGILNLGLSHGIPGPLLILSKAYKRGIVVNGQYGAIKRIVNDLLKLKNQDDNNWGGMISIESYMSKNSAINEPTRSAWCYGTPGTAFSLLFAAEALNDNDLYDLSKQAMIDLIGKDQKIYSPTFCHGYAGISYIYKRFYEKTNEIKFFEESQRLKDKILEFFDDTNPFGFYDVERMDDTVLQLNSIGILQGVVGTLLCLLSFEDNSTASWETAFLLDD